MLIAIEGVDASGKETQANLLLERLQSENRNVMKVKFPNYESMAAGAVKMYLNGDFGSSPDDVNPYAASAFYAIDRYASYKTGWGGFYGDGGIVLADRYTMSNMIHQGVKIPEPSLRREYYNWLVDLEFGKFGLPIPDIIIFLDLSMELRIKLIEKRMRDEAAAAARGKPDIHESDRDYLNRAHICAHEASELYGWTRIDAERDGALRDADDIHGEIYAAIKHLLI